MNSTPHPTESSNWPPAKADTTLAVLVSGGLDSAVLLAEAAMHYRAVYPVFIRVGSLWEPVELEHLCRFLKTLNLPAVRPLKILEQPIADVYENHWSMTGSGVPGADSPDEAVFLPGRNVLLLAKALLWCHLNGIPQIALAPLEANPFPDATPQFFHQMAGVVNQAVRGAVSILVPYRGLHKTDVILRGRALPLEHTFSCIQPQHGLHCGNCNKCAERQAAFRSSGVVDPTRYA